MRKKPFSNEKKIRDSILGFLKAAGLRDRFDENLSIAYWDTTVGKEIAAQTEPRKVVDGIMFVKVDNDAWRQELAFFKHEIIQKLNDKIGKSAIKEIKFY